MKNQKQVDTDLMDLLDILEIRHRAGLYSEWPKPEPAKIRGYTPQAVIARFKRTSEIREFESAIGLGWMTRMKYKFVGWLRKRLGTDDYDVLQAATPLFQTLEPFPTCIVTRDKND